MTLQERQKWLEEHDEQIKNHCYRVVKETEDDAERHYKRKHGKSFKFKSSISEITKYADSIYQKSIDRILHEEMSNHKEEINGVDLKPYLDRIRFNHFEIVMYLLIKDNTVISEEKIIGKVSATGGKRVDRKERNIFKKAKKMKASIYVVHNHPLCTSVKPSGGINTFLGKECEMSDYYCWHSKLPRLSKIYRVKLLDYAVVSECDYFSLEQSGWKDKPKEFFIKK